MKFRGYKRVLLPTPLDCLRDNVFSSELLTNKETASKVQRKKKLGGAGILKTLQFVAILSKNLFFKRKYIYI